MLKQLLSFFLRRREKGLIRAAEDGRLDVVRRLLEGGVDPNATSEGGFTALMWAAARGHIGVVKALLESGAQRSAQTPKGRTAMDIATQEGQNDITALLREPLSSG